MSGAIQPGESPSHAVVGDVFIDLCRNGLVSVWSWSGWILLPAGRVVDLAKRATDGGSRVHVSGAVRSKMGRAVVDRIELVCDPEVIARRGDHPAGWVAVAVLERDPTDEVSVDLIERATEAGELRRLMLEACRWACPVAYDALRRAAGAEATPVPAAASATAISIPRVRRDDRWAALAVGAGIVFLLVFGLIDPNDSFTAASLLHPPAVALLSAFGAMIVIMGRAHRYKAVCFDGPLLWRRKGRAGWVGPIDLRQVDLYYEENARVVVNLTFGEIDPAGRRVKPRQLLSEEDRIRIEESGTRYRTQVLLIDGDFLLRGLGRYIDRYLDRERCIIGRRGWVLDRQRKWKPRRYDELSAPNLELPAARPD